MEFKTLDLAALSTGAKISRHNNSSVEYAAQPYEKDEPEKGMGNHRDLFLLPVGIAYECQDADTSHVRTSARECSRELTCVAQDRLFGKNLTEVEYYRAIDREARVTEAQSKLKRVTMGYRQRPEAIQHRPSGSSQAWPGAVHA